MSIPYQHKRSSVANRAPVAGDLSIGEVALNFADKKIFTKDASNAIITLSEPFYKYSKEFHVDPVNGVDTNDGGEFKPKKTIASALTAAGNTGCSVILHPGTYTEAVTFTNLNVDVIARVGGGGLVNCSGAWTINHASGSARFMGISFTGAINITTASGSVYIRGGLATGGVNKTGGGYVYLENVDTQGANAFSVTGAGTVSFVGGIQAGIVCNNAAAVVSVKDSSSCAVVTNTLGTVVLAESNIYSATATGNAVSASAGSITYFYNSRFVTPTGTQARVNLPTGAFYGIVNTTYDRANSVLTGTNLGTVVYSDALNIAGNVAIANVANLRVPGGSNGQFLTTNGNSTLSWATVDVANANVAHANTANTANVANVAYSVDGANVFGTVASATVAFSVDGANVSGTVSSANVSVVAGTAYSVDGANVSGDVANATYANTAGVANSVALSNVSGAGNIASINLNGNASTYLSGNGSFRAINTAAISNGTSNVSIATSNGNVSVSVGGNANVANFTANGLVVGGTLQTTARVFPESLELANVANLVILGGANGQVLRTDGNGNISWANGGSGNGTAIANGNSNVSIATANGNVTVSVGGSANIASFTANGLVVGGTLQTTARVYPESLEIANVANLVVLGGNSGQYLRTDGNGVVTWANDSVYYTSVSVTPRIALITGNIYDATGFGGVTSIDQIAADPDSAILPASGTLKYNLLTATGTKTVTVRYLRNGNTISQSIFTLGGQTFSYTTGISAILIYGNDDHDNIIMDADGAGVISRTNTSTLSNSNWDKFRGTTEERTNSSIDSVLAYPAAGYVGAAAAVAFISFPGTQSSIWVSKAAATYKINTFATQNLTTAESTAFGTGNSQNSLFVVSDGINQFLVGQYNSTVGRIFTANLVTGVLTSVPVTFTTAPTINNATTTEEDMFGSTLFTVDGAISFYDTTNFIYGGTTGFKSDLAPTSTAARSVTQASTQAATQTGQDVFGSIDRDGSVWFADWGHDNNGMFATGYDDQALGVRKTNITRVTDVVTSATPIKVSVPGIPEWINAGTIGSVGLSAVTTAPTLATTTVENRVSYRQLGNKEWEVIVTYEHTNSTGAANGNGDYLFTLPAALSFNTTLPFQKLYTNNNLTNSSALIPKTIPGGSTMLTDDTTYTVGWAGGIIPYSSTQYRILAPSSGSAVRCWGSDWFQPATANTIRLQCRFTFQST